METGSWIALISVWTIMTFLVVKWFEGEAEKRAAAAMIKFVVEALRNADKIVIDPVTVVGEVKTIENCVFLGNLHIKKENESND